MRLIRKFGPGYGQVIENPARELKQLEERQETKKDVKKLRKAFYTLLDLSDEWDLDEEHKVMVFQAFSNTFLDLPEAQHLLTFNKTK